MTTRLGAEALMVWFLTVKSGVGLIPSLLTVKDLTAVRPATSVTVKVTVRLYAAAL